MHHERRNHVVPVALSVALLTAALAAAAQRSGAATLAGTKACDIARADSVWRTPIRSLPLAPNSAAMIKAIGATAPLHPDFGSGLWNGGPIGIPYTVVPHSQAKVHVAFLYASESTRVGYPIPRHPQIEGGPKANGDRHVLVLDKVTCTDYELWDARPVAHSVNWTAGSGAVFNLRSNALRPARWTSADAAGLAILPGLVRPEDIAKGVIDHAIRVTVPATDTRFIWPARHEAGVHNASLPPMGLRLRLKAAVDISRYPRVDRIILQALKTYGMIVADNGSAWYLSGVPSAKWSNDQLHLLDGIVGADFEVVNESCLEVGANSARAALARCTKGAASHGTRPHAPLRGATGAGTNVAALAARPRPAVR